MVRKRIIGDLYLVASLLFIFLGFVYLTAMDKQIGILFLAIGLVIALIGALTRKALAQREQAVINKPVVKTAAHKRKAKKKK